MRRPSWWRLPGGAGPPATDPAPRRRRSSAHHDGRSLHNPSSAEPWCRSFPEEKGGVRQLNNCSRLCIRAPRTAASSVLSVIQNELFHVDQRPHRISKGGLAIIFGGQMSLKCRPVPLVGQARQRRQEQFVEDLVVAHLRGEQRLQPFLLRLLDAV